MSVDPDDDALTWGGETDPTHVETPLAATAIEEPEEAEPGLSSALLVTYGVFGGIFLLYVVGWIIAVQRNTTALTNPFFEVMYRLGEVLAVASPALWFVGVLYLARERRAGIRLLWLLLGVVLVVPLPFVLSIGAK
ncbi:MAG TPA: hypothetical protein VGC18_12940 [Lacisediminihabitans sp.]|uniref:hypothetical protein n=1 Tax=Lacisediminihabitans sp. TaxID=2787631 RepID=UPI002ED7A426